MGTISLLFALAPRLFLQVFFKHGHEVAASGVDLAAMQALAVQLMRFVAAYNLLDAGVIIFVLAIRRSS
jgi:hypothetical protein